MVFTRYTSTPEPSHQHPETMRPAPTRPSSSEAPILPSLSTFTAAGLTSKKQWILPDSLITLLKYISPILLLVVFLPLFYHLSKMKRRLFWPKVLLMAMVAVIFADLFSSILHLTFVDNAFSTAEFKLDQDGYMLIPVLYGYSSCHHYFPSNWKDVDDSTSILTVLFIMLFFIPLIELLVGDVDIKVFIYMWYVFLMITPISHKYMHERHHERYVPWYFECLYRCGLFLPSEKHVKHHQNDIYDWGLLNGYSDPMFNLIIRLWCKWAGQCPIELMSENYKIHEKTSVDNKEGGIVKMRFIGDIEGKIVCKREGTRLLLVTPHSP